MQAFPHWLLFMLLAIPSLFKSFQEEDKFQFQLIQALLMYNHTHYNQAISLMLLQYLAHTDSVSGDYCQLLPNSFHLIPHQLNMSWPTLIPTTLTHGQESRRHSLLLKSPIMDLDSLLA